ncbi:hypothetical protein YOLOSWAG_86 [Erwinia phage vB_EamM_Yoloswag]|uniref:Uncharacterized protein n=1 Tax=Erwinia phage vB_EamM_Yoloswag TaxID=1958956 RepID=A0A1S6L334_9CAUD|nr:hypothetical protein HOR66_gp086 [Erwinia phage vB_EamM_Yoloswag]AQT28569.1 hypothetical protein YOLOSWAG_86 [Erwinia phage vB_EamM_Yoloswag]
MINASSGRTFLQETPASTWEIQHNCGRPVGVTVCVNMPDGKLHQVMAQDVVIVDDNNLQVIFPYEVTGHVRVA